MIKLQKLDPKYPKNARFLCLKHLNDNQLRIYLYLQEYLGNNRVPMEVRTIIICNALVLSYKTVRTALSKLLAYGLVEKWTSTFVDKSTHRWTRISRYRMNYS
jgi:predicted DNA-binding transcriptional regulator